MTYAPIMSNDELSEAIRIAWDMTNRTGTAQPCHSDIAQHLRELLKTQQARAAAAMAPEEAR